MVRAAGFEDLRGLGMSITQAKRVIRSALFGSPIALSAAGMIAAIAGLILGIAAISWRWRRTSTLKPAEEPLQAFAAKAG